jgi:hypothetical protein
MDVAAELRAAWGEAEEEAHSKQSKSKRQRCC